MPDAAKWSFYVMSPINALTLRRDATCPGTCGARCLS